MISLLEAKVFLILWKRPVLEEYLQSPNRPFLYD
jgi:hypothetical protein